jgi:hypothetical protein
MTGYSIRQRRTWVTRARDVQRRVITCSIVVEVGDIDRY